jgi:tetratricopeptide (TPR) repeat protein
MNWGDDRSKTSIEQFLAEMNAVAAKPGGETELVLRALEPHAAELLRRAAIPHEFHSELLRVLDPGIDAEEAESLTKQFLTLSMVTPTGDTLQIHDTARRALLAQWFEPERMGGFRALSARLAGYYAEREGTVGGLAQIEARRQRVYHLIGADPDQGISALEDVAGGHLAPSERETLIKLTHEYDTLLTAEQRTHVSYLEARLNADLHRLDDAEKILLQLLRDPAMDPILRREVMCRLGNVFRDQRMWDSAADMYQQSLAAARLAGDRASEHELQDAMATLLREAGRLDEAQALLSTLIATAPDPSEAARHYNSLGTLLIRRGDAMPAIEALEKSRSLLLAAGASFRVAQVANNLGLAYAMLANWKESQVYLEEALRVERNRGDTIAQGKALLNLVPVYAALGQQEKTLKAADEATALFAQLHDWYDAGLAQRSKARLLRRMGRGAEMLHAVGEAISYFRLAGLPDEAEVTKQEVDELQRRLPWFTWVALGVLGLLVAALIVAIVNPART